MVKGKGLMRTYWVRSVESGAKAWNPNGGKQNRTGNHRHTATPPNPSTDHAEDDHVLNTRNGNGNNGSGQQVAFRTSHTSLDGRSPEMLPGDTRQTPVDGNVPVEARAHLVLRVAEHDPNNPSEPQFVYQLWGVSVMRRITYEAYHLWGVSLMRRITYEAYHLWGVSLMRLGSVLRRAEPTTKM
jgi:hypothetical protein